VYFDFGGSDTAPGTQQNTDGLGPPRVRFKTADDATIDAVNPIPIVAGQTKYSYWKHIYLKCATAPSVQVDNVKFYTDGGGFGTGITLNVGEQFPVKNAAASTGYEVAGGTPGDTGEEVVANHGGITSVVSAFSKTDVSPLVGPTISEAGNIINAIGETTNYLVFQMVVIDTATPGDLADETLTFQYDEI